MDSLVQWATILSPIIAVVIAWWASKSSTKGTAQKLAALEDCTTKQVESIKELTRMQIEVALLQLRKELWEVQQRNLQNSQRLKEEQGNPFRNWISDGESIFQKEDRRRNMQDMDKFLSNEIKVLKDIIRKMEEMANNTGGK